MSDVTDRSPVLDSLYELMGKFPAEHDVRIIDPLRIDTIEVTAQESESCQDREGSWVQMAQEYGFESDDGSW